MLIVQERYFPLFGHIAWIPNETEAGFSLENWSLGGDHWDVLILCGWRLSSMTWNPTTSPWMKQSTWLRTVHCGDWRLRLMLCALSGSCQKRRRIHDSRSTDTWPWFLQSRLVCGRDMMATSSHRWVCLHVTAGVYTETGDSLWTVCGQTQQQVVIVQNSTIMWSVYALLWLLHRVFSSES